MTLQIPEIDQEWLKAVETPEGWDDLVTKMLRDIHEAYTASKDVGKSIQFGQIKEKFADLRVYNILRTADDAMKSKVHEIISLAEVHAKDTCMFTGRRGGRLISRGGWYCIAHPDIHQITDKVIGA